MRLSSLGGSQISELASSYVVTNCEEQKNAMKLPRLLNSREFGS